MQKSRDGGQIALRGCIYQFLYSCYLILSEENQNVRFQLEGIEDIDRIQYSISRDEIIHIQLKYSTQRQNASFLQDVLKSFLEAYLINPARGFKLVYDFDVAEGNLKKLFNHKLDNKAKLYWVGIVDKIKAEAPSWKWEKFLFEEFISQISFERKSKNNLAEEIENKLIEKYDIANGNVVLFANGLKVCCLQKMECRESIDKGELDVLIEGIKEDISKGIQNPAHGWIQRVVFDNEDNSVDLSYFEGKKPTPKDIARQLPVRRESLEEEIKKSIQDNRVTVIKASSGQGKTTMAFQVSYNLQNEYQIYQLKWCDDSKELGNIVRFFQSRVKVGEKPLIIMDNLDAQLSEWNRLSQLFQEEVSYHYKLIITTREDDWYNYSGDLSNVQSLKVVKLELDEKEAQSIYEVLHEAKKVHSSISSWQSVWSKVADKRLLIEYMYLLTHGVILSERITQQIKEINKTNTGKIKCEILRKVCLADVCGVRISVNKLIADLSESTTTDYGEILKSIENEFLLCVDTVGKYVEGLHPVRSQHIVEQLHEFIEINK